ncbi:MAG: hypothetical protein IPM91_18175 [Bacteroidetes bacterium]|nr:hypothetical protein [Bacteroidota bacterium]
MRKKKMMIYISIVLVLIVLFWQTGISSGTEQRSYVVEKCTTALKSASTIPS